MTKRILVLSLAALGFAAAGCSTPAVPTDTSVTASGDSAYADYQKCVSSLPVGWDASYCDGIRSSKTSESLSYEQFTLGSTKLSSEDLQSAYKSYLSTLDSATLSDLSAQWQEKTAALQ